VADRPHFWLRLAQSSTSNHVDTRTPDIAVYAGTAVVVAAAMHIHMWILTVANCTSSENRVAAVTASAPPCVTLHIHAAPSHLKHKYAVITAMQHAQHHHASLPPQSLVGYAEDDVQWHPDFCKQFTQTVAGLPLTWGSLHLCPGFAWGRSNRGSARGASPRFAPERQFRVGWPRAWQNPPDKSAWLGGPVAMVVHDPSVWASVVHHIRTGRMGLTDVDLTNDALEHPGRDWVARDPPLCTERRGPSTRVGANC